MKILFLTHYFPPEVNAPASRTYEHAKEWVKDEDTEVTVITNNPNHPEGVLYEGYENRWFQREEIDGIEVIRVKTYLTPNEGFFKRTVNYLFYMLMAIASLHKVNRPDVVIATSPQLLVGLAGFITSKLKKAPFVFEVRDLWPDAIIPGSEREKLPIRFLESLAMFLYHKAEKIVGVAQSTRKLLRAKGIPDSKIEIIPNGIDDSLLKPEKRSNWVREKYKLNNCFVVSYIGTIGVSHGLHIVLKAAKSLQAYQDIVFLFVGEGAEKENLIQQSKQLELSSITFVPMQPKENVPAFVNASDVCLVHLRKFEMYLFVLPSKMFEIMACGRPMILNVDGEARDLMEQAKAGIWVEPENTHQLVQAILQLKNNPSQTKMLGMNARNFVVKYYLRSSLAIQYKEILKKIAG